MDRTTTARTARFYEPELDALRFCAFLAVFFFHAVPSSFTGHAAPVLQAVRNALAFGVPVFFLLSAYLITKLLLLERARTGSIAMRSFYARRVLRIWPLYLVFLFAMWVLGRAGVFQPVENGRLAASLLFAGNWYVARFGFAAGPTLPLWTISLEEQFYLLWPTLARTSVRTLRVGTWAVLVLAITASAVLSLTSANPVLALWVSSLVQFQFFALGSLLAQCFVRGLPRFGWLARTVLLVAGLGLLLLAAGPLRVNTVGVPLGPVGMVLGFEVMAAGVVLVFLSVLGAGAQGLWVPRPLAYLGKISYGLYVFHVMALELGKRLSDRLGVHGGLRTVSALLLTIALAMLSYRWLERPFLLLKERFSPIKTRPA